MYDIVLTFKEKRRRGKEQNNNIKKKGIQPNLFTNKLKTDNMKY